MTKTKQQVLAKACGSHAIHTCQKRGFCIDCAPASMVKAIRAGRLAVTWNGPKP